MILVSLPVVISSVVDGVIVVIGSGGFVVGTSSSAVPVNNKNKTINRVKI